MISNSNIGKSPNRFFCGFDEINTNTNVTKAINGHFKRVKYKYVPKKLITYHNERLHLIIHTTAEFQIQINASHIWFLIAKFCMTMKLNSSLIWKWDCNKPIRIKTKKPSNFLRRPSVLILIEGRQKHKETLADRQTDTLYINFKQKDA